MTAPVFPQEGGCRCGAFRFRLTAAPIIATACHCTGCQRMTASAFSTTLTVAEQAFALIQGDPVLGGLKRPETQHHHCPECHGWVFTTFGMPFVNARATLMDDTSWVAPFAESWVAEKLPWAQTGARHSFDGLPDLAAQKALMGPYAAFLNGSETVHG